MAGETEKLVTHAASSFLADDGTDGVGSCKNLWILLSGSSLTSQELVGTELKRNLIKITDGLRYYGPPSAKSAKQLQDDKCVDSRVCNLILQLSKWMKLDEVQCYDLFCDFLLYDYRGTDEILQATLGNERIMKDLMLQIWDYYRCERLYLLLCLKEILSHFNDDSHPYHELFEEFLTSVDLNGKLKTNLLEQWKVLSEFVISGKTSHTSVDQLMQTSLLTFTLREQCELLQVIFLYFDGYECKRVDDVLNLLESFKKHGFGWKQANGYLLDGSSDAILQLIGYLECLVILRCLSLHKLRDDNDEQAAGSPYFLSAGEDKWKEVDSVMCRLVNVGGTSEGQRIKRSTSRGGEGERESGRGAHIGPLGLAWTAVRFSVLGIRESSVTRNLGRLSVDCGVFEFLDVLLQNPVFQGDGPLAVRIRRTIADLLSILLTEFDENSMGDKKLFYRVTGSLLKDSHIAQEFWEKGFDISLGIVVLSSMGDFPFSFRPFVDMLSNVASASSDSAARVLDLFSRLPFLTIAVDPELQLEEMWNVEGHPLRVLKHFYPFETETICLPVGTVGYPVKDIAGDRVEVVRWEVPFSGWQLGLVVVDRTLRTKSVGFEQFTEQALEEVTSLVKLICNVIRNNPNAYPKLRFLVDHVFLLMQRLVDLPRPPLGVLSVLLELASAVVVSDSDAEVQVHTWLQLVRTGILPSAAIDSWDMMTSDVEFGRGAIAPIIATEESVSGSYSITLAFLDLISSFVESKVDPSDRHLAGCVAFVTREIFPSHGRWWFRTAEQKEQVGQKCLQLFHRILNVEPNRRKHAPAVIKEGSLSWIVLPSLLHQEGGHTLLQIICTGEEAIHKALEKQTSWVSGRGLELLHVVKMALSVLNRILLVWSRHERRRRVDRSEQEAPPLVTSLCGDPMAIRTVANYVRHRFDTRLATLALLVMKRFAKELPVSLKVCLGSEASAFCKLLLDRLEERTEDVRLKTAILTFLASCIEFQAGTIEAVIGWPANDDDNGSDSRDKPKSRCLQFVIEVLRESSYPKELRTAAVDFIGSIWMSRLFLAMNDLEKCPDLWSYVLDPLLKSGLPQGQEKAYSGILFTLAQEMLLLSKTTSASDADSMSKQKLRKLLTEMTSGSKLVDWAYTIYKQWSPTSTTAVNHNGLLRAWKSFLFVGSKNDLLVLSNDQKVAILESIVDTLQGLLDSGPTNFLESNEDEVQLVSAAIISETLLLLLQLWRKSWSVLAFKWLPKILRLLEPINTFGDSVSFRTALDVVTAAVLIAVASSSSGRAANGKSPSRSEEMTPRLAIGSFLRVAFEVLNNSILALERAVENNENKDKKKEGETFVEEVKIKTKLVVLCSDLLQNLLQICHLNREDEKQQLCHARFSGVLESLVSFLSRSVSQRRVPAACHAILLCFASSEVFQGLLLEDSRLLHALCIPLIELHAPDHSTSLSGMAVPCGIQQKGRQPEMTWSEVYLAFIQLMSQVLANQTHFVSQTSLDFLVLHIQVFETVPVLLQRSLDSDVLSLSLGILQFLFRLSLHCSSLWKLHYRDSFQRALVTTSHLCYVAVAYLIRLQVVAHIVQGNLDESSKLLKDDQTFFKRIFLFEDSEELKTGFRKMNETVTGLLQIACVSVSILCEFSPQLTELLQSDHVGEFDLERWDLLLDLGCGTPSLNQIAHTCFGTVVSAANLCLRILTAMDATSTSSTSAESCHFPQKQLIVYFLEKSLFLLLTQASLVLFDTNRTAWEKQLFRRELGAELSSCIQSRYLTKRSTISASPSASTPISPSSRSRGPFDRWPFANLVSSIVENLFFK